MFGQPHHTGYSSSTHEKIQYFMKMFNISTFASWVKNCKISKLVKLPFIALTKEIFPIECYAACQHGRLANCMHVWFIVSYYILCVVSFIVVSSETKIKGMVP